MTFATLRLELPLYEMSMNVVGNKNVHVCLHSNNLLLDTWGGGEGGGVLGVFHLMFISLHVLFLHSFFSHTQKMRAPLIISQVFRQNTVAKSERERVIEAEYLEIFMSVQM